MDKAAKGAKQSSGMAPSGEPAEGLSWGAEPGSQPTWGEAWNAWLRIAALSFGGPAGQISVMHRILVEEKGWIPERQFQQALSFCLLLPGPEAHQLVTYTGWMLRGWRGGLCAGCLFILPGAVALLGLSWLYVNEQTAPALMSALYGIRAATVALVAGAVVRLARRTLHSRLSVALAVLALALLASARVPFPAILALTAAGGAWATRHSRHSKGRPEADAGVMHGGHHAIGVTHTAPEQPPAAADRLRSPAASSRRASMDRTLVASGVGCESGWSVVVNVAGL